MPAGRRRHHDRAFILVTERRHGFRLGFGDRGKLDRLAFAVEAIEFGGERRRFGRVVAQQQTGAEIGPSDAPARIDARSQHEAEMPGFRRTGEPRHIHQRGQPDALAAPHCDEALGNKGAIEAFERHHIGNGAERNEIEEIKQFGLRPYAVQKPRRRSSRLVATTDKEDKAHRREMAKAREIVEPIRVDDRGGVAERFVGLVVIDDEASRPSCAASASGSMLVVPQSTVTSSVAPRSASERIASTFGP